MLNPDISCFENRANPGQLASDASLSESNCFSIYSKTCLNLSGHSKRRPKICFQKRLVLNAGLEKSARIYKRLRLQGN